MRDMSLRAKKDEFMVPLARRLFGAVHPNTVSLIAMVVGLIAAVAILSEQYWIGLALWLLNRILDGLDGVVARVHDKQSDFGGYLDLLLDFVVYLTVPMAFVWVQPTPFNLWALVALVAVYVLNTLSWTVLSAMLEKRQRASARRLTSVEMPPGLIEGAETILFYTLFFLLSAYVGYLYLLFSGLVIFTVAQRVWWAYQTLD
ncbi:MAG: CDP-alcohol phosphatidyltransferase family protein [Caldilineaceae bacterium]|nr:CDP-alcohol phosphatidyltransferase family protein [Caldilineaceae bacterium]